MKETMIFNPTNGYNFANPREEKQANDFVANNSHLWDEEAQWQQELLIERLLKESVELPRKVQAYFSK